MTTIYSARRILTMNPARPEATHVAVRDGRILGAGTLEELTGWGAHAVDTRFADKILMPGLVEGHSHTMEGTFWRYAYVGYFERMDPDGRIWPGVASIEAVVDAPQLHNLPAPEGTAQGSTGFNFEFASYPSR